MQKSTLLEKEKRKRRISSESFGFIHYDLSNESAATSSSFLILYGVLVLLLGCVLPFSDTLIKLRTSCDKYSLEIFYILQATISIIGIIYMEWLIRSSAKNENVSNLVHEISDIQETNEDEGETETQMTSNHLEGNKTRSSTYQESREIHSEFNLKSNRVKNCKKTSSHNISERADFTNSHADPITRDSNQSEGINLYLRIGAAGFGFFVMVYDGLTMGSMLVKGILLTDGTKFLKHFLHLIWIFLQTFFIHKNHRIVFNAHKLLVRFITMHLIVANIGQWAKIIIYEIQEELFFNKTYELHQDMNETVENLNRSAIMLDCTHKSINPILHQFESYLFPCVIEYSLIVGGIFMKKFQTIGRIQEEEKHLKILKQIVSNRNSCDKSYTGLAVGMLISTVILTLMIIFVALKEKPELLFTAYVIQQTTNIVLMISTTFICLAIYTTTKNMHYHPKDEEEAFDINLLLICVGGVLSFNLFVLVSSAEVLSINLKKYGLKATLSLTRSLCEIIQCIFQTGIVMVVSTRCVNSAVEIQKKPGRSLILCLLICNLALWVENTFPIKLLELTAVQNEIYSEQTWRIITRIFLPLRIFYRFHSTVCLYDIWGRNYQTR